MWMLDPDYDGTRFCARRVHLPQRLRREDNRRVLEGLSGRDGCPDALHAAFGWTSKPFPAPRSGEIAVRLLTGAGGMMNWIGTAGEGSDAKGSGMEKYLRGSERSANANAL